MEAVRSSETSVNFLRNTRRHFPEEGTVTKWNEFWIWNCIFFFVALQTNSGLGRLLFKSADCAQLDTLTHSHTHTHTHSRSLTHSHTQTHAHTLTHTNSQTHSHTTPHTHSHTPHTHPHTHTHTHTLTHTHSHTLTLTHTNTHPVGRLWTNDQLAAEAATYMTHKKFKKPTSIHSAGFEPAVPAIKLLQTHALDRKATGISGNFIIA